MKIGGSARGWVLRLLAATALFAAAPLLARYLLLLPGQEIIAVAEQGDSESPAALVSSTTIYLTGDVMLGRNVELLTDMHGEDYPMGLVPEMWRDADAVIGNLEGPIPPVHKRTLSGSFSFSFAERTAGMLKEAGFTALSLANNHALDAGSSGYVHTKDALASSSLSHFGHPHDPSLGISLISKSGGMEIVCVGLNATYPKFDTEKALEAVREHSGAFAIVYIHWGDEYQPTSSAFQRDFAKRLVGAGADLVVGHHPHVIEEAEVVDGALVVYSLGNFVFDQYFSKETQEGMVLRAEIGGDTVSYELVPVVSERSRTRSAKGDEARSISIDMRNKSPSVNFGMDDYGILRLTLPVFSGGGS